MLAHKLTREIVTLSKFYNTLGDCDLYTVDAYIISLLPQLQIRVKARTAAEDNDKRL